jgi:hypothetical protein
MAWQKLLTSCIISFSLLKYSHSHAVQLPSQLVAMGRQDPLWYMYKLVNNYLWDGIGMANQTLALLHIVRGYNRYLI